MPTLQTIFPPLQYPLTRQVTWKGAPFIAYTLALIIILIVCLLNVALVGYEAVTEFKSDFNATGEGLWFDAFVPTALKRQIPGTLCSPHVFNAGEPMVTNNTFFDWKVGSVFVANAGRSGFSYQGEPLENCDIDYIDILGDLRTWSLETTIYMVCISPSETQQWVLGAATALSISALPERHTIGAFADSEVQDTINELLHLSAVDIWSQFYSTFAAANTSGIATFSAGTTFEWCSTAMSYIHSQLPRCILSLRATPNITLIDLAAVTIDNVVIPNISTLIGTGGGTPYDLDPALRAPVLNHIHLAYAAARTDIGNIAPNNFPTNLDVVNATLTADLPVPIGAPPGSKPARSQLYEAWKSQIGRYNQTYPAFQVFGPSSLEVVFTCRLLHLKSVGTLIVSVLVATQSIFMTIWGIGLLVTTFFVNQRDPRANHCEGCVGVELHTHNQGVSGEKMESSGAPTPMTDTLPVGHNHSHA